MHIWHIFVQIFVNVGLSVKRFCRQFACLGLLILLGFPICFSWPASAIAQPTQIIQAIQPVAQIGAQTVLQTALQSSESASQPASELTEDQMTADSPLGESLFSVQCAACHAHGGNIVRRGKTLKQKALVRNGYGDVDAIAQLITQGKGAMPAYADRLSAQEIGAIAQYVHQKANTGW
jgi:cytochrome c6